MHIKADDECIHEVQEESLNDIADSPRAVLVLVLPRQC